jgi:type IV pilus assembly protein PilQ
MKRNKNIILSATTLILIMGIAFVAAAQTKEESPMTAMTIITGITVMDNAVEIKANRPFVYTVYKPSDPFRVVVDISGADIGAFKDVIKSNKPGISEVIPSQADSQRAVAKIEILLQSPANFEQSYQDNTLIVRVREEAEAQPETKAAVSHGDSASKDASPQAPVAEEKLEVREIKEEKATIVSDDTKPLPKATEITDVRFEQAEGVVKFVVKGNGSMSPSVFTLKDRIVLDMPDVKMKSDIPSSTTAPVKRLRVGKYKEKTRLVMDLSRSVDFDVSSIKDMVIVSIKTPEVMAAKYEAAQAPQTSQAEKKEAAPKETAMEPKEPEILTEGKYTGKKISLDFQDADIIPIFRLLSDISGYNFVVNPDVKGKITMKLVNVPWDQTLELIMKTHNLGKSVEGNIIRIAPLAVLAKESEEKAKLKEAEAKADPLETRTYPVSYADVAIVEKAVKDMLTKGRGSVTVDRRTSSMVVKDVASVFPDVESLLMTLDKPTPQVMIEARIVEINTSDVRDLGIQWGVKLSATNTLLGAGGLPMLGSGAFTGNNYLVDFPSGAGAGAGSGFNFGILNPARTMGLDMQLSAVETAGKGKIISNPRIMTIDNGKAKISQGDSIPIRKLTAEGTISTEFKDYTLEMIVTPHITPDNSISMIIETKKEEPDWSRVSSEGTPASKKREANTSVIIRDGETVVIGGVFKTSKQETDSGTPGLMDIPILGWLFKKNKTDESTSEMIIFITPRIVHKP